MPGRPWLVALLLAACAVTPEAPATAGVAAVHRLHGHNDYLQPRPLLRAVGRLSLWLERVPLVREIAGSLLLSARRP